MQEITIKIDNLTSEEGAKVQETIMTLFERDVFFMKNGKVVLHFDHEGTLQEIQFDYKRWKRRRK